MLLALQRRKKKREEGKRVTFSIKLQEPEFPCRRNNTWLPNSAYKHTHIYARAMSRNIPRIDVSELRFSRQAGENFIIRRAIKLHSRTSSFDIIRRMQRLPRHAYAFPVSSCSIKDKCVNRCWITVRRVVEQDAVSKTRREDKSFILCKRTAEICVYIFRENTAHTYAYVYLRSGN